MKFLTSDHHFYHANVIKYSNRLYRSVEDMNDDMIDKWNEVVRNGDIVYHLGDFTLESRPELIDAVLGRLNGKIFLIKGNHDKWIKNINKLKHKDKFVDIVDYKETNLQHPNGTHVKAILMHYPMHTWNRSHHGSIHCHGHCHGSLDRYNFNLRRMDVGVDSFYGRRAPIPETFIADVLTREDRHVTDHHGD